jgi:DNA-directed RNA polymerase subunit RPC12/RpoP
MKVDITCAWCKRTIRTEHWDTIDQTPSHTICDPCATKLLAEARKAKTKNDQAEETR